MKSFRLKVITGGGSLFEGDVVSLRAEALDGGIGILPGHAPLVTLLSDGNLMFQSVEGDKHSHQIDSGTLEVDQNHNVVILAGKVKDDQKKKS